MESLDWITIRDLRVNCVIGIFAEEDSRVQPVSVTLRLGLAPRPHAVIESLEESVDYLAITGQVSFLLAACRFRLLETAADALTSYLLAPPAPGERRAAIQRIALEIHKPNALPSPTTASLSIERAAPQPFRVEVKSFGTVDVIHEAANAGIYRLNVAPGRQIPLHVHHEMEEHELVLTRGIRCQGREVFPGTAFHWPRGAAHFYENPSADYQTVLCVDRPRFILEDEVEVAGAPAEVAPEHVWAPRDPHGRLIAS